MYNYNDENDKDNKTNNNKIKTLTMDRGIEFLKPLEIKQYNIEPQGSFMKVPLGGAL